MLLLPGYARVCGSTFSRRCGGLCIFNEGLHVFTMLFLPFGRLLAVGCAGGSLLVGRTDGQVFSREQRGGNGNDVCWPVSEEMTTASNNQK